MLDTRDLTTKSPKKTRTGEKIDHPVLVHAARLASVFRLCYLARVSAFQPYNNKLLWFLWNSYNRVTEQTRCSAQVSRR